MNRRKLKNPEVLLARKRVMIASTALVAWFITSFILAPASTLGGAIWVLITLALLFAWFCIVALWFIVVYVRAKRKYGDVTLPWFTDTTSQGKFYGVIGYTSLSIVLLALIYSLAMLLTPG